MTDTFRISAKTIGELALPGFCPRCFWLKQRLGNKLPYQIFPGIFSSIDVYTKNMVHNHFDRTGVPPAWLAPLGKLEGYIQPPPWQRFKWFDPATQIELIGSPDGVFRAEGGSIIIVDYKTSRYTQAQDALLPLYHVQLNAYAWLGEHNQLSPVSRLALVYMEPVTDLAKECWESASQPDGFHLGFSGRVVDVPLNPEGILPLLARTRQLVDLPAPPAAREGCIDCERVLTMMATLETLPRAE